MSATLLMARNAQHSMDISTATGPHLEADRRQGMSS